MSLNLYSLEILNFIVLVLIHLHTAFLLFKVISAIWFLCFYSYPLRIYICMLKSLICLNSMETLDLSAIRSQLISLDASTQIHLIVSADFCSFAHYDYICTVVDALVILPLFTHNYLFKYQIVSK